MTAPYNPYAAPTQQPVAATPAPGGPERLASLGFRFGGAFIDGLFALLVGFAPAFALGAAGLDPFPHTEKALPWWPSPILLQLCALLPNGIQWTLVTISGQSLGKKALGTRIVRVTGEPAGFTHGVALRALPLFFLGAVGVFVRPLGGGAGAALAYSLLTTVIAFVDPLFIFRADRRCLHDLIAGTEVIAV